MHPKASGNLSDTNIETAREYQIKNDVVDKIIIEQQINSHVKGAKTALGSFSLLFVLAAAIFVVCLVLDYDENGFILSCVFLGVSAVGFISSLVIFIIFRKRKSNAISNNNVVMQAYLTTAIAGEV
ncbi:Hypothetical_protein [Hexamita inflata]|uniref:Hypothetical_protein n=1 Tax=Hexamita inflata TaxID=28002 RepID=A0AA86VSR0_9EUKA|nr:Hypothetical protein HINF_LOCUS63993 [Hexamita inflata]